LSKPAAASMGCLGRLVRAEFYSWPLTNDLG
jgi:hypothetical protein